MNLILKKEEKDQIIQSGYDLLSKATQKAYTTDLNSFLSLVGKNIENIGLSEVVQYLNFLEKKGYKNSTINRKIFSLTKIFDLFLLAGKVEKNHFKEIKKLKKITKKVNSQVHSFLEIDDVQKVIEKKGKVSVIVEILANTGLRISELIGIKYSDVEDFFYQGFCFKKIRIVGKRQKERFVFLSEDLYEKIKKLFFKESDFLFHTASGKPFGRSNLYNTITKLFLSLAGKKATPHSLRHFFATHKISKEKQDIKAVSMYLGHASTATTLDMYVNSKLSPSNCLLKAF